ncbi:MAG: hypothetical protein HS104_35955 [Polyangiaceae bacterium]|nr:hypothetical protein [Polyangiaceae bacterium]MCL4750352.1 hypothetical protein [Myxococcales bacterium]
MGAGWWVLALAGLTLAALPGYGCGGTSDSGGGPAGAGGTSSGTGGVGGSSAGGSGGYPSGGSGGGVGLDVSLPDSPSDALSCPDGGVPGDPGCACGKLEFSIDTQQSCAISILPGFQVDGEGFINVGGQNHRVFAMDRWGKGHVIAWCDSTRLPQLLAAFNVTGYLGQTKTPPKVLAFGDEYLCKPGGIIDNPLPAELSYEGKDLPAKYKGNAALLAQEWDVVVFCGFRIPWTNDWSKELGEFVSVHGKGLLAVMDYQGVVTQADFTNMSKITSPAGLQFDPLSLAWAPSSTSVSIECVPDLPPPIK